MPAKDTTPQFAPVGGGHGVESAVDGGFLLLRIPVSDAALKAAKVSSTGKSRLVGSTGGFSPVPGCPVRVNVSAIVKA